jgi:hypothetical protein
MRSRSAFRTQTLAELLLPRLTLHPKQPASVLSHRLTPIPDPPFILPVLESHPVRFEQFTIIASMVKFFATTGPIPIPVPPDIEADVLRNWICEHFSPIEPTPTASLHPIT